MRKIVITGGCGFIGSHLTEFLFKKFKSTHFVILDKITYAANKDYLKAISKNKRLKIIIGDINNKNLLNKILFKTDLLINLAAESHVDRSFSSIKKFIHTNVQGTRSILDACILNKVKKIIHVSTDEVYGEIFHGNFNEDSSLNPTNPYSASKAAAEMIIKGYQKSFKLDIITIRSNNIFGTRQFPEKIIPSCIYNLINNKKILIHGSGNQKRTFLHVDDFSKAILLIIKNWKKNEIYNLGSNFEYKIIDLVNIILKKFNKNFSRNVNFIEDRLFNDFRYSVNTVKIKKLKWIAKYKVENRIDEIIQWYKLNSKSF